jgi:phage host-nuclease inhibitor protein Gam
MNGMVIIPGDRKQLAAAASKLREIGAIYDEHRKIWTVASDKVADAYDVMDATIAAMPKRKLTKRDTTFNCEEGWTGDPHEQA